jgi:hypothetical protein
LIIFGRYSAQFHDFLADALAVEERQCVASQHVRKTGNPAHKRNDGDDRCQYNVNQVSYNAVAVVGYLTLFCQRGGLIKNIHKV